MQKQKGSTSVIVSFIIVALVIVAMVYALTHKSESPSTVENLSQSEVKNETPEQNTINSNIKADDKSKPAETKPMETNKKLLPNFTPVAHVATLQKIDTVVGTGAEVKAGDTVSVHYIGAIAATGEVFQSSKDFGPTPITFPLSGVIKGWTDGIPGMKVGGTRRLVIPSAQAYGAKPDPRSGIPPNADLVFDVELIGIK